jgi:hypothetical protein
MSLEMVNYMGSLYHYGVSKRDGAKVGSGRYPLGSGENPFRHYTEKEQHEALKKVDTLAMDAALHRVSLFDKHASKDIDVENMNRSVHENLSAETKAKHDKLKRTIEDYYNLSDSELEPYKKAAAQMKDIDYEKFSRADDLDQGDWNSEWFYMMDKGQDINQNIRSLYEVHHEMYQKRKELADNLLGKYADIKIDAGYFKESARDFLARYMDWSSSDYEFDAGSTNPRPEDIEKAKKILSEFKGTKRK